MLTGDIRNQIDRIWDAFWSGGISNPLEVIEQITYLLFIRRLDDLHAGGEQGEPAQEADRAPRVPGRQRQSRPALRRLPLVAVQTFRSEGNVHGHQ